MSKSTISTFELFKMFPDQDAAPFCGTLNIGYQRPGGSWQFVCMAWNCGASGPAHDSRNRALELWNGRVAPADNQLKDDGPGAA